MDAAEYTALAAVEDDVWYFRALHRLIENELARTLGSRPASILDAGCGTGGLMRRLAPRHPAWNWHGVDLSPIACDFARQRTSAQVTEASILALPFQDRAFDAVVLADVLYYPNDDAAALRECVRVLRPGGVLVATMPAHDWLWSYHDEAVGGRRRYSLAEAAEKAAGAGFGALRVTPWNALALPLVALRRKLLPPPRSGSDVRPVPALLNAAGLAQAALERAWLRVFGRLPFGVSILVSGVRSR